VRVAAHLAARLREGRTRPGHARLPRQRPGPLPRRGGRGGVTAAELAQRAIAKAAPAGLALVTHERSLMLRFAAGRPTQATAIDDFTLEIAVPLDGHVGRAATNAVDDTGIAECAE